MQSLKYTLTRARQQIKHLNTQETRKFYFQETFGSHNFLKPYLMSAIFFIIAVQLILNLAENIRHEGLFEDGEAIFVSAPLFIGCLTFPFLFLKKFENQASNSILLKFFILLVSNTALSFSSGSSIYYFFKKISQESPDYNVIYNGTKLFATGFIWILFTDIMTPFWYLKFLVPLSYFIGLVVGTYEIQIDKLGTGWIYFILSILNIALLCWVKTFFRWKLFVHKNDNDNLNQVHKLILNKVPNPIVVFDEKGDAVYSNPEFKRLAMGNIPSFLQRIVKLRRRRTFRDPEEGSLLHGQDSNIRPEKSFSSDDLRSLNANSGGMRRAKTIGPFETIEEADDLSKLLGKVMKLFNDGRMHDETYLVFDGKLRQGQLVPTESSFEVTLSFISEYQRIIVILKDTTEHAKIIALETNNEYKDKLLASVSHELKTPLNSNLFLIEAALNHEEVPQTIKDQFLAPAYRSGKLLFYLIKDILDYSQIAAKKLRLNFEEQNIRDTINSCYHLLELQVNMKGLEFSMSIDPEIPTYFLTDHDRVRQILLNLLSNALKFTFKGGKIALKAKMLNYTLLRITVEDAGIGIRSDDLKKLFQEFTRIDNTEHGNVNAQGVGLGLTIADKIAKRLGPKGRNGGIKVESEYGKGSKFSFAIVDRSRERSGSKMAFEEGDGRTADTQRPKDYSSQFNIKEGSCDSIERLEEGMPFDNQTSRYTFHIHNNKSTVIEMTSRTTTRRPFESGETTQMDIMHTPPKGRRKRMLVVDDDPFNILAIESYLKRSNIEIDCAYNGKEAIEKVQQSFQLVRATKGYDLIFMDCQMPVMDGYQATQILSEMMREGQIPEIPIIGCTAFEGKQRVESCYEAGMREVINKPLSQVKLASILKNYVG